MRPPARRPLPADADFADSCSGINQFNVTFSQGIDGLGSTDNGNPLASRAGGRVDFTKIEGYVSRLQPLFGRFSALIAVYGQYAVRPAARRPSSAAMAAGSSAAPTIRPNCWATLLDGAAASCATTCRRAAGMRVPAELQLYGFIDTGKAL